VEDLVVSPNGGRLGLGAALGGVGTGRGRGLKEQEKE
jgi:hypothetical protein